MKNSSYWVIFFQKFIQTCSYHQLNFASPSSSSLCPGAVSLSTLQSAVEALSKALGLQSLGDKLLADLAASWWFLLLGMSCLLLLLFVVCYCLLLYVFFSFLFPINSAFRCYSFSDCGSSLGFGDEVKSVCLTTSSRYLHNRHQIGAYPPSIDLLTRGLQRHLSKVDI